MEPSISSVTSSGYEAIRGNRIARRAIEIAAAGGHHVLLVCPSSDQREILARALCDILPPMNPVQERETAWLYSMAGIEAPSGRPFRVIKPGTSIGALLGGGRGKNLRPGEVSLAHNGVLLIDGYDQMPKAVREALRAPLEEREVILYRYPDKKRCYLSRFQMVATINPCPCGRYYEQGGCQCTQRQRDAYFSSLSSPVLDRITVQACATSLSSDVEYKPDYPVELVRKHVLTARERQAERFRGTCIRTNDEMSFNDVLAYCEPEKKVLTILDRLVGVEHLNGQAYFSILKIARTIADLDDKSDVESIHLSEAVCYYHFLNK